MLERCRSGVIQIVQRGVVVNDALDKREVDPVHPMLFEDREVGVVRKSLVDRIEERAARWMGEVVLHQIDQPGVVCAGFEHVTATGCSSSLEIDHCADVVCPGVIRCEGDGPQEAVLLTVIDQEDDVVGWRRAFLQNASDLE